MAISSSSLPGRRGVIRLIDAHCHLQDSRVLAVAPHLISETTRLGVSAFVVNGTSETDWKLVKEMSEREPTVLPSFGIHPWFADKCSTNALSLLRKFLNEVPSAAVGEIGLDKGCKQGIAVDYEVQKQIFKQQLELAKLVHRPVSVHCVSAFSDLQEILRENGPFPAGVILHSYMGSAELVKPLASLGAYFSFSGFLTHLKQAKAKRILQMVPKDRLLLETDAPDALPHVLQESLFWVPGDPALPDMMQKSVEAGFVEKNDSTSSENDRKEGKVSFKNALNHPANIYNVLEYVSSLLEVSVEEIAETSYTNTVRLFSYPGSKLCISD